MYNVHESSDHATCSQFESALWGFFSFFSTIVCDIVTGHPEMEVHLRVGLQGEQLHIGLGVAACVCLGDSFMYICQLSMKIYIQKIK